MYLNSVEEQKVLFQISFSVESKIVKLPIIASYICFQYYFKITSRGQKYCGFLLNCTKIPLIVLWWESRSTVSKFQNRICIANQKKENKMLDLANEEIGAATVDSG